MSKPINHNSPIPEKNIVLVGMMGCGKSTVARALAKILTYPLVDTDQHIMSLEHKEIPDIFKIKGEAYFRQCEFQLVESLVETKIQKHIISTGGGLPIQQAARDLLPNLGYVVWLDADIETLHERTSKSDSRPLLKAGNPKDILTDLLKKREADYDACSHLKISTSDLEIDDIVQGILESARFYFSERLRHTQQA